MRSLLIIFLLSAYCIINVMAQSDSSAPTDSPTKAARATAAPKTKKPIISPTAKPSISLTPTGVPTFAPTTPTEQPTTIPTSVPTVALQLPPTTVLTGLQTDGVNTYATTSIGAFVAPTIAVTAAPTLGERRRLITSLIDFTKFELLAFNGVAFKAVAALGNIIILVAADGSVYVSFDAGKTFKNGIPLPGITKISLTDDSHVTAVNGTSGLISFNSSLDLLPKECTYCKKQIITKDINQTEIFHVSSHRVYDITF